MKCEYCGTPLEEGMVFCTQCGAAQVPPLPPESERSAPTTVLTPDMAPPASRPGRPPEPIPQPVRPPESAPQPKTVKKPTPQKAPKPVKQKKPLNPAVAVLLKIASALLCILLTASLTATLVVLDVQQLTSQRGLTKVVEGLLCEMPTVSFNRINAAPGAIETVGAEDVDQESLLAWFYDTMKSQYGDELKITQQQMQAFLEQSTAKDYVSEKLASYVSDFVNGTNKTELPADEILDVLDENLDLAEEIFGMKIDRKVKDEVSNFLERNNINEMIQSQVIGQLQDAEIPGVTDVMSSLFGYSGDAYTVGDLLDGLKTITSPSVLAVLIMVDLLLCMLLLLTNRFRFSAMLIDVGVTALVLGLLVSLPVAAIQILPLVAGDGLGLASVILDVLAAFVRPIAPVHYGAAIVGLLLTIIGGVITPSKKKKAVVS